MPLQQPVIKAMARGVRAQPQQRLTRKHERKPLSGMRFRSIPDQTASGKRYPTTVNALGMLRASLAMAKEKE